MSPQTQPSEQTPILRDHPSSSAGTIQHVHQSNQDDAAIETGSGSGSVPLAKEPSTLTLLGIMLSVWLGTFLAALDSTLVATLTGEISSSFNSLGIISWLASAYFIANAALQPLSGKLTDIYGRRAGLIFSNVFFAAGNLICGLAKEEWVIVLGRVVAGMGGGGLTAISTFIASDLVPLRRRGVWQGFGNISFGLGSALGGVFGGAINDAIGWRWAFLIQVPFTVLSCLLIIFTVKIPIKETDGSKIRRIDYLGALTLIATLVLLLIGLNSGGNTVPWTHPLVLVSLPVSAALLGIFVYIEAYVAVEPIIPVRIMVNRTVLAACFTNWFCTMAYFGLLFYGPIYFQMRGYSATQAGVRMIPQSIGVAIGSVSTGMIMRRIGKYYWLSIGVQTLLVLSFGLVITFNLDTPDWPPFIYFFMMGIGYSGMLTVTLLALIASVDHKYQAVITSASYASRSTGSTIGITIGSAVFQNLLKSSLWERLGKREGAVDVIAKVRENLGAIKGLDDKWRVPVLDAYMQALRGVFGALLALAALGALVSLATREHKLHTNLARRDSNT